MSDQEDETTSSPEANQPNGDAEQPAKQKLTKNQKRKLRNKRKKLERKQIKNERESAAELNDDDQKENRDADENVEIEYVPEKLEIEDSSLVSYVKVFERFSSDSAPASNEKTQAEENADDEELKKRLLERKKPQEFELKEDEENEDAESKISKRKLKVSKYFQSFPLISNISKAIR